MHQRTDQAIDLPYKEQGEVFELKGRCTNCAGAGRVSRFGPRDRFCSRCGKRLRLVEIQAHRAQVIDGHFYWLIAPNGGNVSAPFQVVNSGVTPTTVPIAGKGAELRIDPSEIVVPAKSALDFVISGDSIALTHKRFQLHSPDLAHDLNIRGVPAPLRLLAYPKSDDYWSNRKFGRGKQYIELSLSSDKSRQLRWTSESVLALVAEHSKNQEVRFVLEITDETPEWRHFFRLADITFLVDGMAEPVRGVHFRREEDQPGWEFAVPLEGVQRVSTDSEVTVFETDAESISGSIRIVLPTLGAPEIELALEVWSGRPFWNLRLPRPTTIPQAVDSLFFVELTCLAQGEGPNALADSDIELDVVSSHGKQLETRRDVGLRFACVARAPEIGASFTARLWHRPPMGMALPLSEETKLELSIAEMESEIDRRAKSDRYEGTRNLTLAFVVDFGTSNTCVCRVDGVNKPMECHRVPGITQPDSDVIPTTIAFRQVGDGRLDVWIGQAAEQIAARAQIGAVSDVTIYRNFKPLIGEEPAIPMTPDLGITPSGFEATPETLTKLYLEHLLLEIRAGLSGNETQRLVEHFCVTFPSTFNHRQRSILQQILVSTGSSCGVRDAENRARILMDEANAAAFPVLESRSEFLKKDDVEYAAVFDFGGGTLDFALLAVEWGPRTVHVRPLGLTGLRQLGGSLVTERIARLLHAKILILALDDAKPDQRDQIESVLAHPSKGRRAPTTKRQLEAAAANLGFIRACAEKIKIQSYGAANNIDFEDDDWYEGLNSELTAVDSLQKELSSNPTLILLPDGDSPRIMEETWYRWIGKDGRPGALHITRDEVDQELFAPLQEVMQRARRLWASVCQLESKDRNRPDHIILAGGSANIPLLRKLIADPPDMTSEKGGFGFPAQDIKFDSNKAKSNVVVGAARHFDAGLFVRDANSIKPLSCGDFILHGICHRAGKGFETIFPSGKKMDEPLILSKDTPFNGFTVALQFMEDMDLRSEHWAPSADLKALGITAPGKELLVRHEVQPKSANADRWVATVTYELTRTDHNRVLTMRIGDDDPIVLAFS